MSLDKRVGQYVALRDKIDEIKKKHEAELAPYKDVLNKLGALLLDELTTKGVDSMKTAGGTFYRRTVSSVSVEDGAEFRRHVLAEGAWNLADLRANKPGVEAYVSQEGVPPPGVKFSQFVDVGVRRPPGGTEG